MRNTLSASAAAAPPAAASDRSRTRRARFMRESTLRDRLRPAAAVDVDVLPEIAARDLLAAIADGPRIPQVGANAVGADLASRVRDHEPRHGVVGLRWLG